MNRRNLGWIVRAVAALSVFVVALEAFRAGVDVSDRPGLPQADLSTQFYYSTGLFVLGGMDLGTPVGGPRLARSLLWGSYFLAPLITTSTVLEGILRLVDRSTWDRVGLRNHMVVVGLGRLGNSFVAALRGGAHDAWIVGVDNDVHRTAMTEARRLHRVCVLPGDIRVPSALRHLSLERARGVALLTDDDLLNLRVAFRLAKMHPRLSVVAHCSDLALKRELKDVKDVEGSGNIHIFNAHRAAAKYLYKQHLKGHFPITVDKDTVVLAGFGRFSQTLLEYLEREASEEIARVVIVAPDAALELRKFLAQVNPRSARHYRPIDGDLSDPDSWQAVHAELGELDQEPAVIIGSEDEGVNLQSAMLARRLWPKSHIFVRCEAESSFADELARRHGFTVLAVDGLMFDALRAAQRRWFPNSKARAARGGRVQAMTPGGVEGASIAKKI
jgi:TrkA-N domain